MVYDPVNKQVVLFGGDQLNQLTSDTWTFDGQKWEEKKPGLSPAPRGAHALVWLPKARKVLLLGGYGYESAVGYYPACYRNRPMEAWTYDTAADRWELIGWWEKDCPRSYNTDWIAPYPVRAAAGTDDLVVVLAGGTWLFRVDASKPDVVGAARLGVKPGAVERRKKWCDPEWYREAPAGDPARTEAELASLPSNTWVMRDPPNRPGYNVDWGTAVYAPELDLIMRFSGGHCAYSGTAPQVYDVKTDRWSIPFAPEMPVDFCSGNSLVPGEWSFTGSPWMLGHTYKSTGYEPESRSMVFAGRGYSYFFDPGKGKWSRAEKPNPFRENVHVTTLCTTPRGVVAWALAAPYEAGLFLLDAGTRTWSRLPLEGTLPRTQADQHGMVYDSMRDRLLLFSSVDKENGGDVMAYDMKSGQARWLEAAGRAKARVPSREAIYLSHIDMVLQGGTVEGDGDKRLWLVYDCEKNAWSGAELGGADPVGKGSYESGFNVSLGLMYDPNRKLVWAADKLNKVYVLKFDPRSAPLRELK